MSSKRKNRRKKEQSLSAIGREFLEYTLDMMISIYMLAVIVIMPLYNEEGFTHIGTDKFTFLKQSGIIAVWFVVPTLILFLLCLVVERGKKISIKLSLTDKFALLYGGALLLSYFFSEYKDNALWGASGWYMGLLTQLMMIGIYFCISRFWTGRKWHVFLFLPVSAIVFVLGYLNRFGVFPIDMKVENVQFISTIGNINWYCGYLVSVFWGGYYLLWNRDVWKLGKKTWQQGLLMLYVAIGFATLVTHGSMSGLVTMAVMLMVAFCLSVKDVERMFVFWQELLLLSVVCLLTYVGRSLLGWQITYTDGMVDLLTDSILPVFMTLVSIGAVLLLSRWRKNGNYPIKLFRIVAGCCVIGAIVIAVALIAMISVNTLHPGSLGSLSEYSLFTFSPTWGSNRATTWKAGAMCFLEQDILHKLVGVGPDSMSSYLYSAGSENVKSLVREVFKELSLTNAHNEWLTILVNTGILGAMGFVGMMISAIVRFIRHGINGQQVMAGACGFGLLAYTVNNMFSFQQSMSVATVFVILGIGEAVSRKYIENHK